MATKVKYYIKEIVEFMCEQLQGICEEQEDCNGEALKTEYPNHRPASTGNHQEFLVASLSRSVYSHGPFQNAAAYVDIVVRNGQGGVERTYRLQEILDEVCDRFPIIKYDENDNSKFKFIIKEPKFVLSGDDQLGFTVWKIRGTIQVNTTDRYAL